MHTKIVLLQLIENRYLAIFEPLLRPEHLKIISDFN